MRYIFKVLVLGNPKYTPFYVSNAFIEDGEDKESYFVWYKELNIFEDVCDLEIDVISDMINTNFDELLTEIDGIIYFLNPSSEEELEFFDLVLPVINSIKRDIPTIIMYYDLEGIIPISVNEILENLWVNHPQLEAFVNILPRDFHQPLQCLCLAMITGDTPLNIENAWMRFPIFILLANFYFKHQQYFYTAQAVRKAAMIADIFNKAEFYVISEQAALLYSKINLYLEASKILQKIDKKKSENFKKLYAESIILEGNKLFNKKKYDLAARQYLAAAQWAAIELKDRHMRNESFRLAINSWISACKVENAFQIFTVLPHEGVLLVLKEIVDKIIAAAEFLVKSKKYIEAKDQLYKAITLYQREGLFDDLEKFTYKQVEVLTKLLEVQIKNKDNYSAKYTYDEIENLWESYEVKRTNLDKLLEDLIILFLNELNFGMATNLMNKLTSLSTKKKLTKFRVKIEEEAKELRKKEIEENIQKGVMVLGEFIQEELQIITNINEQIIKEANILIENKEFIRAADRIKNQANFLKSIGKEDIQDEILSKSLDILIIGKNFTQFFPIYTELSDAMKKKYLVNKFQLYIKILKEIILEKDFEEIKGVFENSSKIYRDQMLYEQAQEIGEEYIQVIKEQATKIVDTENNLKGVEKALVLIKKASDISYAYLENTKIDFNELYRKITEIYINFEKYSYAHAINDRIDNSMLKAELHKKIAKLEAEKSSAETDKAKDIFKEEELIERYSLIKNKAREAFQDQQRELRQRKGLKRAYFEHVLYSLDIQDYKKAIKQYKEIVKHLIKIKQYNLAGVSLAVLALILIKENRVDEIKMLLKNTKKELSSFGKLFSETFAITLIEYILDVEKLKDEAKLKNSIVFMENLPLFEQEIDLLYSYIGKELKKEEPLKALSKELDVQELEEKMIYLASNIQKEKQDIAKRKLMRNQYWRHALEDLSNKKYEIASTGYIDTIPPLMIKNFYKQAAVSLIIGSLLKIKGKDINSSKSIFYDNLSKLEKYKSKIEELSEIKLFREFFFVMENDFKNLIRIGLENLIDRLVLFQPEIDYLQSLIPEEIIKEELKETITRKDLGRKTKLLVEIEQNLANLRQKMGDVRREKEDVLRKRTVMRRRYYKDIITTLQEENFKLAGEEYYNLGISISKRKDFSTSSLLILLHGLAFIKVKEPIKNIRFNVKQFLDSLGLNKRLVEDTFYIRCIHFILDVIENKLDKFIPQFNEMLEILPLFEEENKLKKIEL
ncbi:MAG: hypothetical protein ACXACC_02240 [Promethearchaeota archaeon]|jgi:hypothetical protein